MGSLHDIVKQADLGEAQLQRGIQNITHKRISELGLRLHPSDVIANQ